MSADLPEKYVLRIEKAIDIDAPVTAAFAALLEQLGPGGDTLEGQPLYLKLEPWPGGRWYRDTTWYVGTGTGTGFVTDPRGIAWSPAGLPSLLVADRGNKQAKTISPNAVSTGYVVFDGSEPHSPAPFTSPEAVAADLQGFLYVVDRNPITPRVVRYDPYGQFVQVVNLEPNADSQQLLNPVTVGVDDSVAYVGDRGRGQVIRYKRRP